ncbi:sulfatase [Oceaniferula marina]|nr:sulfatase [Oceaniferula marina]
MWKLVFFSFLVVMLGLPVVGMERPNIIFLLADDFGYADMSGPDNSFHETPHLNRLAREGMSFSHAYASHPTCAPSRLALMTGKYPARHACVNNGTASMDLGEVTVAEALKRVGYVTCHAGKWHLGGYGKRPEDQGFDFTIASNGAGMPGSFHYPFKDQDPNSILHDEKFNVPDLDDSKPGDHLTDRLTDKVLGFMRDHKDKPFYLNLCYYAVHTPIEASKVKQRYFENKLTGKSTHRNASYAGLVSHLDDSVGRILQAVKDLGIEQNTIVVFFSDNGGLMQATHNGPLRQGKATPYEGGDRVPCYVRWPGVTPAGRVCPTPVIGHDFYPTILRMAGAKGDTVHNKEVDGLDLTNLLRNPDAGLARDALHWLCYPLPVHYQNNRLRVPSQVVRKGDWKLIKFLEAPGKQAQRYELYNLKSDLGETKDVSRSMPEKTEELQRLMDVWRKQIHAPDYDASMYQGS